MEAVKILLSADLSTLIKFLFRILLIQHRFLTALMLFGNYITYNNEFSKGALSLGLNEKFFALRF